MNLRAATSCCLFLEPTAPSPQAGNGPRLSRDDLYLQPGSIAVPWSCCGETITNCIQASRSLYKFHNHPPWGGSTNAESSALKFCQMKSSAFRGLPAHQDCSRKGALSKKT